MEESSLFEEVVTEQNYKQLFEQAPAPIAIYKGRELRYVFVNDAYLKIFNGRDILGKTIREAFPELEGQGYFSILEEVYDSGKPYHGVETPAIIDVNNNGHFTTRYYNLVYTSYKNAYGVIEGVMAFGHDVTDQVEARMREKEGEQRFRNIFEQSTDVILILKGDEMVLDVANDNLLKLWNVDKHAIGKKFLEILPEMKDQGFFELLQDVYRRGINHYGYETPAVFQREGGAQETVYFNFVYQPYREKSGKITGVLILATDVTEQVITKQKLKQTENSFRHMVMQAPVGIAILKGDGLIVELANKSFVQLSGKEESSFTNRHLFDVIPEVKGHGFENILRTVLSTGVPYHGKEVPVILKRQGEDQEVYVDFVYHPINEVDGIIRQIMIIAIDATEKVLARKKVEESEKELQQRVEERTSELEKKNSELEQFAHVSSHDLQEPLRKIRMFSGMIKEKEYDKLADESKSRFDKIINAVERMSTSLTDLLNFTSLSKEEQFKDVDLNEVVDLVILDLELVIEQKSAIIKKSDLPLVRAIPLQMQQLFYNLLNNALKFSRESTRPEIEISVRRLLGSEVRKGLNIGAGKQYYQITVKDNGIGFDEKYAEQIFHVFQRLHDKKSYSGTGIGLALCKKVTLNHEGDIYAVSKPHEGASFNILLPL